MDWAGFPFCINGYGYCDPVIPPPKPEEEWPNWPMSFAVQMGSWKTTFGFDKLVNVLLSSSVGALTACFGIYIFWRIHFNPKSDPNVHGSPQQTTNHSTERPGPLGDHDHDIDPPAPRSPLEKYKDNLLDLNMIMLGCSDKMRNRPKSECIAKRHCPSRSRSRSHGSRKPSTLPPTPTTPPHADVQTQSSQCQLRIDHVERLRDPWNPLVNYFVQFGGGSVDDELPTFISEGGQKLVLHQFARGKCHPCPVPYAMKLESMLRMCGIPYDIIFDCDKSGPWISIGRESVVGAQSCIKFVQKYFSSHMKDHLSPIEKKVPALYISILLDFHLYWGVAIWRCMIDDGQEMHLDQPISAIVLGEVEKGSKSLKMTGSHQSLGRMKGNEILETIRDDLTALTASLGSKNFLIGDSLTDIDCSAFAILSQLLWSTPGHPFEELVRGYPSLVNYCLRIRRLLWPDWDQLLGGGETSMIEAVLENNFVLGVGKSRSQESSKNTGLGFSHVECKSTTRCALNARRVQGPEKPVDNLISHLKIETGGNISSFPTQRAWPVSV